MPLRTGSLHVRPPLVDLLIEMPGAQKFPHLRDDFLFVHLERQVILWREAQLEDAIVGVHFLRNTCAHSHRAADAQIYKHSVIAASSAAR